MVLLKISMLTVRIVRNSFEALKVTASGPKVRLEKEAVPSSKAVSLFGVTKMLLLFPPVVGDKGDDGKLRL